jgi:hypothetical protein
MLANCCGRCSSGLFRSRASLEAENLALRQQIIVLQRTAPKRLCVNTIDRVIFVGLYRLFPDLRDALARQTRDRHSLAPCWVQSLLALEVKAATGKTDGAA